MVDVGKKGRLEELGRRLMMASVEAEYLGLRSVVGYLDGAFVEVVKEVTVLTDEEARVERRERQEAADAELVELEQGG